MSLERFKKYAKATVVSSCESKFNLFLTALFSIKRMLVVTVDEESIRTAVEEIKYFAQKRQLDLEFIDAKKLTVDDVRGEIELDKSSEYYTRTPLFYWPDKRRKVIVVEGVDNKTDIEVLRAFLYVACLGSCYDRTKLPDDKLPDGSGFIFLANDDFPYERLLSITGYWLEESQMFDMRGVKTMSVATGQCARGLSPVFMKDLKQSGGVGLNRILEAVKSDSSLALEIRKDYINIYYRGGNLIKISEKNGVYSAYFNLDYLISGRKYSLSSTLKTYSHVTEWLETIPLLKNEMDLWFGKNPKNEREFQQLMVRENNFKGTAKGTDYFICDIEYANTEGRFDLIAAYWPSSGAARKNNQNVGLAVIEMKYMDGALAGKAGILTHIKDMKKYFDPAGNNLALLKEEMKQVFNQKKELGLIDNEKKIEKFSDRKLEYIFVFANHDPDSKILYNELQKVQMLAGALPFELKFATSNFMGYGLYKQNIYSLDDFLKIFHKQIYSKIASENE